MAKHEDAIRVIGFEIDSLDPATYSFGHEGLDRKIEEMQRQVNRTQATIDELEVAKAKDLATIASLKASIEVLKADQ